ncbi:unnamed protein product, partial [Prorocentrum cordatum]
VNCLANGVSIAGFLIACETGVLLPFHECDMPVIQELPHVDADSAKFADWVRSVSLAPNALWVDAPVYAPLSTTRLDPDECMAKCTRAVEKSETITAEAPE